MTRIALPTGDARASTGELLAGAGIEADGYEPSSRVLRSMSENDTLQLRIFRERDIPVQVALGNYDIGICGDAWLTEMSLRFPLQRISRIGSVPGPTTSVWLCAAPSSGLKEGQVPAGDGIPGARIVSEFPNIADAVAVHLRIPAYRLLTVHGSADAYPPEDAELVVMSARDEEAVRAKGLVPLHRVFTGGMALIANSDSLGAHGLSSVLKRLAPALEPGQPNLDFPLGESGLSMVREERDPGVVRLAVPDGHAQRHAPGVLREIGVELDGYDEKSYVRRPVSDIPGLTVKVVRPQDMPQLVAMGMFDLGISGRDLLYEHLSKFPNSPVAMAVDLGTNRYRIGPVVPMDFPVDTTPQAVEIWNGLGRPVRIASEFPATAERFARDHHLQFTSIIPVAGASEGFVPEDADFLVEGTETGTSIRANGLKMLDPFMESTSCVLVRSAPATTRVDLVDMLVDRFKNAAAAVKA